MRLYPHRLRWLFAASLACCATARAQVEEETLKAAFVYNFALYTTWPTPPRDAARLTVCVRRTSTLAPALRALAGKPVQARRLAVRELEGGDGAGGCDVRIVEPQADGETRREPGVLTVCDCGEGPDMHGAVVALVREGNRLRFDIDVGAANASMLSLSSKLLRLARTTR